MTDTPTFLDRQPAVLVLEDGRTFRGDAYGAVGGTVGEAVFSTGMGGYQVGVSVIDGVAAAVEFADVLEGLAWSNNKIRLFAPPAERVTCWAISPGLRSDDLRVGGT